MEHLAMLSQWTWYVTELHTGIPPSIFQERGIECLQDSSRLGQKYDPIVMATANDD